MSYTGKGSGTAAAAAAGTSLTDLKSICTYHGWADTTTAGYVACTLFINHTIKILTTLAPWPEYHKYDGSNTFSASDDNDTLSETRIIRVGTVVRDDKAQPLTEWDMEKWLHAKKYNAGSGPPNNYAIHKYTSSGVTKLDMYVYPNPAAETTLYYTYQVGPAVLVNNSDTTDWPTDRDWLLAEALRTRLAAIDRDSKGVALYGADFMSKVNTAFNQARPSYMPIVAKPVEWIRPGKWMLDDVEKSYTS